MNKILKYPYDMRHKMYFSSDWHIFHNPSWDVPIWEMRGYGNVEDATQQIQDKINERVSEDSVLFFLGDAFLNASDSQCLEWLAGLKCKNIKYLWGNHCANMFRLYKQEVKNQYGFDDIEVYPIKMGNVEFLGNHQTIQIGKQVIVMNHFPLHSWVGMGSRNSIMLSGHSHCSDHTRNADYAINKCLEVGIDWNNDVWSYEEIMEVMSTKTFVAVDHHNKDTN